MFSNDVGMYNLRLVQSIHYIIRIDIYHFHSCIIVQKNYKWISNNIKEYIICYKWVSYFRDLGKHAKHVSYLYVKAAYSKHFHTNINSSKWWEDTKISLETLRNFMCLNYASDRGKYFDKIISTTGIERFCR